LEEFVKQVKVEMKVTDDLSSRHSKSIYFSVCRQKLLMKYDEKTNTVSLMPYEVKEAREEK